MGASVDITEIIRVLRCWRWVIILVPLCCLICAAVAVFYIIPPTYEAAATLLVGRNVISDQQAPLAYEDLVLSRQLIGTYGEIVKSWTVSEAVIRTLNLPLAPEQFREKINVSLVNETQIIRIAVRHREAVLAQKIANVTAEVFSRRVPELLRLNNVAVLDPAQLPMTSASPQKALLITIAGITSLMASVAYVLAAEYIDGRIRDRGVAEKILDLPVLGTIPKGTPQVGKNGTASYIPLLDNPRSSVAEAYRSLRTNVQFYCNRKGDQVISVTSAQPLEGKTTVAINLAIGVAQGGKRVILVDADLRRPAVHSVMGLPNESGLYDLLIGNSELPDDLLNDTPIRGLSVLTSGHSPANPADLLEGSRFGDILKYLLTLSDFVVVDTPPVTAVTDAAIISSISDGVLLVTRATRRQRAIQAKTALEQVNAPIMGLVLNQVISVEDQYYDYASTS